MGLRGPKGSQKRATGANDSVVTPMSLVYGDFEVSYCTQRIHLCVCGPNRPAEQDLELLVSPCSLGVGNTSARTLKSVCVWRCWVANMAITV